MFMGHLFQKLCRVFLISSLVFFLASCSDAKLSPLKDDSVILAFGDSLTEGVGVSAAQSYPSVLAQLTGYKVVNAGISGETTAEGLKRFLTTLNKHNPDLVILLEGGNDFLRKQPREQTKQNLDDMLAMALDQGIEVLLVAVPEQGLLLTPPELYAELASARKVPLEEEIVPDLMRRLSMKSDYVHFNEKGYQALAEAIYLKLQQTGALP